jgi:integrase
MEPAKPKRERGTGSPYRNKGSAVWSIKFYDRGVPRRESSHSTDLNVAERLLKRRLAEVMTDTFVPRQNVKVDELIQDVLADYRKDNRKSTDQVEARWRNHLSEYFARMKACDVKTDRIQRYIKHRLDQGAERATLNRELAVLKRALRLAFRSGKLKSLPYIPMVKESNARRGFLELDGYARLTNGCAEVGLWLRALVETAYTFGFRLGELRSMRCRQINLFANTISLETSKNGEPREAYMSASVRELLTALILGKGPNDFVFTRNDQEPRRKPSKAGQKDSAALGNFRKTWARTCVAAGVGHYHCPSCDEVVTPDAVDLDRLKPKLASMIREAETNNSKELKAEIARLKQESGKRRTYVHCGREFGRSDLVYRGLIFHDLRRCAVRGLIRAGVSQKVAMSITGHKTISVFQRYQIVAPADKLEATRKLEASQEQERERLKSQAIEFGQGLGMVARKAGQTDKGGISTEASVVLRN